jgi:acyl-CoA thioester hydrolase
MSLSLRAPGATGAPPAPFAPFVHRLRVYWEDTDAGGIVFYANQLKFFERARTEWLRAAGIGQQALREATGAIFVVAETHVRWLRPARLDDVLDVSVEVLELGGATMRFAQASRRVAAPDTTEPLPAPAPPIAEGTIRIGCIDAASGRPRRIPAEVIEAVGRFTAAAPSRPAASTPPPR